MALVTARSHFRSCQDGATDVREANSGLQLAAKSALLVTGAKLAAALIIALCCKSISFQFFSNAGLISLTNPTVSIALPTVLSHKESDLFHILDALRGLFVIPFSLTLKYSVRLDAGSPGTCRLFVFNFLV